MLFEQLIDLEKVRTKNLKFRIDLQDQVMDALDSWSVTNNTGHYMAFKHHISFATDLAAKFGCFRFRTMPDIVSKLLLVVI